MINVSEEDNRIRIQEFKGSLAFQRLYQIVLKGSSELSLRWVADSPG